MHPLLTWALALEHLLRRVVIVFVVRLTTDAVELVAGNTAVNVLIALMQHKAWVVPILWRNEINTFSWPIHIFVRVNFEVFRRVRPSAECQLHRVDLICRDCVVRGCLVRSASLRWAVFVSGLLNSCLERLQHILMVVLGDSR